MAGNTIMTAKNSFLEGLVMDFAPDNTQANVLTSALNATLLTFNGNEMSLLNDMGNGRVETAYLPDGYVPVGTCEFGDIIYIVSYNPLIDKAQIGCFPSPERNISSEEFNSSDVILSSSDFLELNAGGMPTGKLKATSVKKVLFQNDLHPGDLYIIYAKNLDSTYLSDYGNLKHTKNGFPKFVNINVVSIEESGKINYLDSHIKWYKNDYYINELNGKDTILTDIDSYRNLVSSAYNTFSSKVSGKLALLIELEKISGFDCTWECHNAPMVYYRWGKVNSVSQSNLLAILNSFYTTGQLLAISNYYTNSITESGNVFSLNENNFNEESFDYKLTLKKGDIYNYNETYELWSIATGLEFNSLVSKNNYLGFDHNYKETPIKLCLYGYELKSGGVYSTLFIKINQQIQHEEKTCDIYIPCREYRSGEILKITSRNNIDEDYVELIKLLDSVSNNYSLQDYLIYCIESLKGNSEVNKSGIIYDVAGYEDLYSKHRYVVDGFRGALAALIKLSKYKLSKYNIIEINNNYYINIESYNVTSLKSNTKIDDVNYKDYNIYLNFNWITENKNINPKLVLFEGNWSDTSDNFNYNSKSYKSIVETTNEFEIERTYKPEIHNYEQFLLYDYNTVILNYKKIQLLTREHNFEGSPEIGKYKVIKNNKEEAITIKDDIINNYYLYPITRYLGNFKIPKEILIGDQSEKLISDMIYNYEITPAMPYGLLEEFKVNGYIDFNKIGTNYMNLNVWRYYKYNNSIQLTYGLDVYTEPNKKVLEVILEFYDNQGICAAHHSYNKTSYNGTFTNIFELNALDSKLNSIDSQGNKIFHKQYEEDINSVDLEKYEELTRGDYYYINGDDNIIISSEDFTYVEDDNLYTFNYPEKNIIKNDAGILFSNWLYLVKIIIKSGYLDASGNLTGNVQYDSFYRWMWTNSIFNEKYNSTLDFKDLNPSLTLDVGGSYSTVPETWNFDEHLYHTTNNSVLIPSFEGLCANIYSINLVTDDVNVKLGLDVGLLNTFDTFTLDSNGSLNNIQVLLYEGNHSLVNEPEQPELKFATNEMLELNQIYPTVDSELTGKINFDKIGDLFAKLYKKEGDMTNELYSSPESYKEYKDTANLTISSDKWSILDPESYDLLLKYNSILNSYFLHNFKGISLYNYSITKNEGILNWGESLPIIKPYLPKNECIYFGIDNLDTNVILPLFNESNYDYSNWTTSVDGWTNLKPSKPIIFTSEVTIETKNLTNVAYEISQRFTKYDDETIITIEDNIITVLDRTYKEPEKQEFVSLDGGGSQTMYIHKFDAIETIYTYSKDFLLEISNYIYILSKNFESLPELPNSYSNIGYIIPPGGVDSWYLYDDNSNFTQWTLDNKDVEWVVYLLVLNIENSVITYDLTPISYSPAYTNRIFNDNAFLLSKGEYKFIKSNSNRITVYVGDDIYNDIEYLTLNEDSNVVIKCSLDNPITILQKVKLGTENVDQTINYMDLNQNIIDLTTSNVYNYTALELQSNKIDLKFSAIKFSKYYITTTKYTISNEVPVLRSLICSLADLNKYNLTLVPDPTNTSVKLPYFRRGIYLGFTNPGKVSNNLCKYEAGLLYFTPDDILTNNAVDTFTRTTNTVLNQIGPNTSEFDLGKKDLSISYHYLMNVSGTNEKVFTYEGGDLRSEIFVPILLGYSNNLDSSKNYNVNGISVWNYYINNSYSGWDPVDLQGSMAIMNNNVFYVENNWIDNNVYTNSRKVSNYLRHLFYYDETPESIGESSVIDYISNYGYLDNNHSVYTRDIIAKVHNPSNSLDDCILFRGINYKEYLNELLKHFDEEEINRTNVNIKSTGTIKNIPFLIQLDYITPTENIVEPNSQASVGTLIKSTLPGMDRFSNMLFKQGIIYGYDSINERFVELKDMKYIKLYENERFTVSPDDLIESLLTGNNYSKLNVSNLNNIFTLSNNKLEYSGNISVSNDKKYKLLFTKNGNTSIGLTLFEDGLKFFK